LPFCARIPADDCRDHETASAQGGHDSTLKQPWADHCAAAQDLPVSVFAVSIVRGGGAAAAAAAAGRGDCAPSLGQRFGKALQAEGRIWSRLALRRLLRLSSAS